MTTAAALALLTAAGLAHATPATRSAGTLGHLYLNPATGHTVFTPANEYLQAKAQAHRARALGDDINADGRPDFWVATNEDPCALGTPSSPASFQVTLDDAPATVGDHHLYKAQLAQPDARIGSVTFKFFTDVLDTDTDSDGIPDANTRGHGMELSFWDNEDAPGQGPPSTRALAARFALTNLPGTLTAPPPNYFVAYYLTLDLSDPSLIFELADADGVGPANGNFNPFVAADLDMDTIADDDHDANGTHDWAVSFRAIQPTNPNPGEGLIGYGLAAPGIPGTAGAGDPNDGIISLATNGTDWVIDAASVIPPMALGFPILSNAVPGTPGYVGFVSLFDAASAQDPDPAGPSAGQPATDFVTFGTFSCGPNSGGPYAMPYLALSAADTPCCPCDTDCSGTLTLDDIDAFVAAFAAQTPPADCNADGQWTLDDIDCFVACFTTNCS